MTFGSLFAGIGGMDLGLERAGMECRWQVEIDPFCRKVLTKHWPNVPKYGDIREITGEELEPVDLIAGGFPCQDVSHAGARAGLDGKRSGLWVEYRRVVRHLRPRYVLVENVAALTVRGLGRVLGDLAESGYDAEWQCLPASYFGAPHPRDRAFIISYPHSERRQRREIFAHARLPLPEKPSGTWATEPPPIRVADGVPVGLDRLRSCGNAVVPQVAEWLGRRILEAHRSAA